MINGPYEYRSHFFQDIGISNQAMPGSKSPDGLDNNLDKLGLIKRDLRNKKERKDSPGIQITKKGEEVMKLLDSGKPFVPKGFNASNLKFKVINPGWINQK